MGFQLGPGATDGGYRLAGYDTIGSTNAEALERAREGDPGKLWIVAREQTEGRGRRGRPWQTASGNLAASLLLVLQRTEAHAATLGFAAGLALEQAIRVCAPGIAFSVAMDEVGDGGSRLRLKWPNDVLLDGAKIAGILLESVSTPGGANVVVIGIGVNVLHAPEGVPYPATSLHAQGADVPAESLFAALADAWVEQEAAWDGGRGFAAIRRRWLERAAGLGAPIAVRMGGEVFRGAFETIDEDGMLVLRDPAGGARRIAAGDVHFGAAATAG
jgi:BirA family biotin operon repressor/biotin-[acetyl-CoA-carboxylase] ligase